MLRLPIDEYNGDITQYALTDYSHKGLLSTSIDFEAEFGDEVHIIDDGQVVRILNYFEEGQGGGSGLGNFVTVKHQLEGLQEPYYATYAHLSKASVDALLKKITGSVPVSGIRNAINVEDKNYHISTSDQEVFVNVGRTGLLTPLNGGDGSHLHIQFGKELYTYGYADATANIDNIHLLTQLDFGVDILSHSSIVELPIGSTSNKSIDFFKDKDYFTYDLQGGQNYQFKIDASVSQSDSLDAVFANLYSASGEVVASTQDGEVITIDYRPTEDGVFYLAVSAGDSSTLWSDKTGDYNVNSQVLAGTSSQTIDYSSRDTERDISYPGKSSGEFRNNFAFAALRDDGSVVTWGGESWGGDSTTFMFPNNNQSNFVDVFSTSGAFAALHNDGSVVTWGLDFFGGDSSSVTSQLNGDIAVETIYSSSGAFAALREDGSVVTWGGSDYGGDSNVIKSELNGATNVVSIFSIWNGFAALREDGSIVSWQGDQNSSSSIPLEVKDDIAIVDVFSTHNSYAALREDGSVITWGFDLWGGDSSSVASQLSENVVEVYSTGSAFAALLKEGSVITWGARSYGGNSGAVSSDINGEVAVVDIFSTHNAFAALREDGSVITWGNDNWGGNSNEVSLKLNGDTVVIDIYATNTAFAALREDGSVVVWGRDGGDASEVSLKLNGEIPVVEVFATRSAFAALREDGSVVT